MKKNKELSSEDMKLNPQVTKTLTATALGKLNGKVCDQLPDGKLSPERRREIAKLAAKARWKNLSKNR